MAGKRIQTHILEKVIGILMAIFGVAAVWIFFSAMGNEVYSEQMAVIEILLIVILAVLAQTVIMIRVYEQNLEILNRK